MIEEGGDFKTLCHIRTYKCVRMGICSFARIMHMKDSLKTCSHGTEIVDTRRGQDVGISSQKFRRICIVYRQIPGQNFFLSDAEFRRKKLAEISTLRVRSEDRDELSLAVECFSVVRFPVHMDGKVRDCEKCPAAVIGDKPRRKRIF